MVNLLGLLTGERSTGIPNYEVYCQSCGENLTEKPARVRDGGTYCPKGLCVDKGVRERIVSGETFSSREIQSAIGKGVITRHE